MLCYFTDAVNNFVNVSFNREKSIVNCSFIKQPLDSQKECSISVGPETPKCNDMVSYSQGGVDDTSNVSYVGFDIDLSFLSSHATKFCFIVNASTESGTRRVILSGIYDTGE